jgi:hypothetical protein
LVGGSNGAHVSPAGDADPVDEGDPVDDGEVSAPSPPQPAVRLIITLKTAPTNLARIFSSIFVQINI